MLRGQSLYRNCTKFVNFQCKYPILATYLNVFVLSLDNKQEFYLSNRNHLGIMKI